MAKSILRLTDRYEQERTSANKQEKRRENSHWDVMHDNTMAKHARAIAAPTDSLDFASKQKAIMATTGIVSPDYRPPSSHLKSSVQAQQAQRVAGTRIANSICTLVEDYEAPRQYHNIR